MSPAEYDAAELAYLTASQQATAKENRIRGFETQAKLLEMAERSASLQLDKAELDLRRTEIFAPFTGVVIKNLIEQNSTVSPGTRIATIEDTSKVEVRCNIRSSDLPFLRSVDGWQGSAYELPAIPATIEFEQAGQLHSWRGFLSRQDGLGVEQETQTLPVLVSVDQPSVISQSQTNGPTAAKYQADGLALMRGMFVRVTLHCEPVRSLAVVAEEVLRPGKQLWLMREDRLKIENVRVARIENGLAYIDMAESALRYEDFVVSSPVPGAREGLPISRPAVKRKGGADPSDRKKQFAKAGKR